MTEPGFDPSQIMRAFDVPPWVAGPYQQPRFPRIRWALRRWWPVEAIQTGPLPVSVEAQQEAWIIRSIMMYRPKINEMPNQEIVVCSKLPSCRCPECLAYDESSPL